MENITTNSYTYIYYANVKDLKPHLYLKSLPKVRLDKVNALQSDQAKKLSVGAYLLLKKALEENKILIEKHPFYYDEKGKPHIEGEPFKISISHSGDYVCVALSDFEVGVDIQEMRDYDEAILNRIGNDYDLQYYAAADNKKEAFYRMWCYKEAYLKLRGEGFRINPKDTDLQYIFEYGGIFYYQFDDIKDYKIILATQNFKVQELKKINLVK